ncbi:MAG: hypothetical protein WKF76_05720 [Nocardioidaceae bacterium]
MAAVDRQRDTVVQLRARVGPPVVTAEADLGSMAWSSTSSSPAPTSMTAFRSCWRSRASTAWANAGPECTDVRKCCAGCSPR